MDNIDESFDPFNPPDLCKNCPDLEDEFFENFTSQWLFRLSCSSCGLALIKNKTILKVIQSVIDSKKQENND